MLLIIYEKSGKLKAIVDKQDKLEKLQEEYTESQDRGKVDDRATKKADETNYIQHYKDLFAIEDLFAKTEYASQKHLITLMYSKGLLNSKGNPLLIPRKYFSDLELIENDDEIIIKPKNAGKGYNYYNYKTGKMYIQSYKTAPRYGPIDIKLSNYTKAVIKESLEQRPRKWLFVTKDNEKYADSSTFGNAIADTLGITVNQILRAFINYYLYVVDLGRVVVAKLARHSVEVNESTYTTQQSNIAIQNTIYDENVINKKVNVKITEGKNKGMTLVGVVTRSLKPNRHKFNDRPGLAYSIKFNKNDNGGRIEEDEQATKIPDASEGITMYVEPELEPEPGPSTRNTRSKGKGKGKKKKR